MSDILIVDDERDIRELIADILQDEGFSTSTAANSDDACEILQNDPPALMVLDIWLKDSRMDGIDILGHVKRTSPRSRSSSFRAMATSRSPSPRSSRAPMTSSKSRSTSTS